MKKLSTSFFMRAAIAIALLFATTGTAAAYNFMYNGLAYNYDGDGTSVYVTYTSTSSDNYGGSLTNVVIPAKITLEGNVSYNVTGIGQNAFSRCSNLQSITIPASVKTIGSDAFYNTNIKKLTISSVDAWLSTTLNAWITTPHEMYVGSSLLTSVTLPSTVSSVGPHFMYTTSIKSVTIPNSVTEIGTNSFLNCTGLTTLNLGSGVKTIGQGAFSGCAALTSVTFPASLKTISYGAFDSCTGLTSLTIPASIETMDGAFYNCTNIKTLGWNAVNLNSNGGIPTANIENVYFGNTVQTIPDNFLSGSKIRQLIFRPSIKTIGSSAFNGCSNLTVISSIPNGCTVGSLAFANCSALQNVTIPEVINYQSNIFQNCNNIKKLTWNAINASSQFVPTANIEQVTIGSGVVELPPYFLQNSKITSLSLPASVTTIGSYAFQNCSNLSSLSLSTSLNSIGSYAFQNCYNLSSLTFPDNLTSIGDYSFSGCYNISKISLSSNLISIGSYAFYNCTKITSLGLPQKLSLIGSHAFENNMITTLRIPALVNSVGQSAFYKCPLIKIVVESSNTHFTNSFHIDHGTVNRPTFITMIYPSGSDVGYYVNCNNMIVLDPNTSFVVDGITYVITDMTNRMVKIVDVDETKCASDIEIKKVKYRNVEFTPTEIGVAAVAANYTVQNLNVGDIITNLPEYSFYKCDALRSIDMKNTQAIGQYAFAESGLYKASLPNSVQTIGQHAFENCKRMTEFVVGTGVNTIDQYVLAGCSALRRVELGANVTTINANSFNGCSKIKTLRVRRTTPPTATSGVFNDLDKWTCTLYVPTGTVDTYKNANEWKTFFFISDSETEPSEGDVNGDGKVNVSDVSVLISMILGTTTMDESTADVNGDGRVNVSDVSALINIILGIQ